MLRPELPAGHNWLAVPKEVGHFYEEAHAVPGDGRHWADTYCGATGTPGTFTKRAAHGKKSCSKCIEVLERRKKTRERTSR
jgi:hypothetical protein